MWAVCRTVSLVTLVSGGRWSSFWGGSLSSRTSRCKGRARREWGLWNWVNQIHYFLISHSRGSLSWTILSDLRQWLNNCASSMGILCQSDVRMQLGMLDKLGLGRFTGSPGLGWTWRLSWSYREAEFLFLTKEGQGNLSSWKLRGFSIYVSHGSKMFLGNQDLMESNETGFLC